MIEYKNPCFVIEVLAHASKFDPNICAIFAGSGPLEDKVNEMARRNSLEHRVKVLGWHEDIPSLMHSCDMLIWPGLEEPKEGLGLGVVEAQAAGLPVLMSLSVPDEAIVEPNLVRVLPLQAGADVWADNILDVINRRPQNKKDALAMVESSSFSIAQSAENIQKLYES
jgi:glycosyltransferase EpsF